MEKRRATWQICVERTLAVIKPDSMDKAEEILDVIVRSGFTVIQRRKLHLSPEQCSDFYAEHYGKMYFPSLTAFMSSGPIIAMVLARDQAISYWRELMGPKNSEKAKLTQPDSLRALYGTDDLRNAVHGSESFLLAEKEIQFMFPGTIVEPTPTDRAAHDYLSRYVNPTLLTGLTQLCKQKPADPPTWLSQWLIANNPNKPVVQEVPVSREGAKPRPGSSETC